MTDYPTTWWEKTGRMTPFEDGVSSPIMRHLATGEERSSRELPIGALFVEERERCGTDGLSVVCVTFEPSYRGERGRWHIDGRASNCTNPDDKEHRCWVRHGTVGDRLTVDKNGNTCQAGGGSFFMNDQKWHGHLRDGVLVEG